MFYKELLLKNFTELDLNSIKIGASLGQLPSLLCHVNLFHGFEGKMC
jgi:hypothetical protein